LAISASSTNRGDFLAREPEKDDRVRGRSDAPVGHDLDEVGARLDLLAGGTAHLRDAVANAPERAEPPPEIARLARVEAAAQIAMSAGLGECLAADEEARARNRAFLQRQLEAEVGAGDVAHAGEAAHQHIAQDHARARGDEGVGKQRVLRQVDQRRHHVDVTIDQARHHDLAGKIDRIRGSVDRSVADFAKNLALDENIHARPRLGRGSVDDRCIAQQDHARPPYVLFRALCPLRLTLTKGLCER